MVDADILEAAVILAIRDIERSGSGGVDDWQIEEAQRRLQSIRDANVSESMLFAQGAETQHTFAVFAECIAVLAYCPGGIKFAGRHFERAGGKTMATAWICTRCHKQQRFIDPKIKVKLGGDASPVQEICAACHKELRRTRTRFIEIF